MPTEFSRNLALVIGINNYGNGISSLGTAVNDAKALSRILKDTHGYKVKTLLNDEANLRSLQELLEQTLPTKVTAADRLLFYFAGHGIALNGEDGPEGYLIPQDASLGNSWSYLPMTRLYSALNDLPCRHFLGILDCCFSGAFRWSSTRDINLVSPKVIHRERYQRFIQGRAWQVITSTASDERAVDTLKHGQKRGQVGRHSPFAFALFEALSGKADIFPPSINGNPSGDGVITATELYLYLRDSVETTTGTLSHQQTPGIWPLKKHDKGEYVFLTPGCQLRLPSAPRLDISKNPYQGLRAFEEEHSDLFFGRIKLVEKLKYFIKTNPFTVVLGASGTGKSSLVKAGLIPEIRKQNDADWLVIPTMRPGESPLEALNNSLKKAGLSNVCWHDSRKSLTQSIKQWKARKSTSKLFLFIDQSEEIITLSQNKEENKRFLKELLVAIRNHKDTFRLVLSLRSDFEPQLKDSILRYLSITSCVEETSFERYWHNGRFFMTAMTRGELREAIERPAESRVLYFQPYELVETVIDEVFNMPGGLPLLSFALSELYIKYITRQRQAENRGITIDRALSKKDYQSLGGVVQALTQRAEEEYSSLVRENAAYAPIICHVMLRMVAIEGGELARRRILRAEIEDPSHKNDLVTSFLNRFISKRLLVTGENADRRTYVEPAHDALIRGWERLLLWKHKNEESILLQRNLTPAAREWNFINSQKNRLGFRSKVESFFDALDEKIFSFEKFIVNLFRRRKDKKNYQTATASHAGKFLWSESPYLDLLEQELKSDDIWFSQLETDFVKQSLWQKRKKTSWRWRFVLTVILSLVLLTATALISQMGMQVAQVQSLINSSEAFFSAGRELDALREGLIATQQFEGSFLRAFQPQLRDQVIQVLQQAVYGVKEYNRLQLEVNDSLLQNSRDLIDWSPDGKTLAFAQGDNTVKLLKENGELKTLGDGSDAKNNPVVGVSWSQSGILATASVGEMPGGKRIVYVSLWDPTGIQKSNFNFEITRKDDEIDIVYGMAWDPSGEILAFPSLNHRVYLYKADGSSLPSLPTQGFAVDWTHNGLIAVATARGQVRLWKMNKQTFNHPIELKASEDGDKRTFSIEDVGWNQGSSILASASRSQVTFLDENGIPYNYISPLQHGGLVNCVEWSSQGILAVGSDDRNISLWTQDGDLIDTLKTIESPQSLSWSPDGETLASESKTGTIQLWKINSNPQLKVLIGHYGPVESVSWHPGGHTLASGSRDNTVRTWDETGIQTGEMRLGDVVNSVSWNKQGDLAIAEYDQVLVFKEKDEGLSILEHVDHRLDHVEHRDKELKPPGPVYQVSWSPDGKLIASASTDRTLQIWSHSGVWQNIFSRGYYINSVDWRSDDSLALAFNNEIEILTLDNSVDAPDEISLRWLEDRKWLVGDGIEGNTILDLSWSPSEKILASAQKDSTVKLWNGKGDFLDELVDHEDEVHSVRWRPQGDGLILASASNDGSVKLWKLDYTKNKLSSHLITTLKGHTGRVREIAWSPDGRYLATAGSDNQIKLWSLGADLRSEKKILDKLFKNGCDWARDYLRTLENVDKHLCS